ncbi:hypothetical protein A3F34_00180 [Candidatus Roizmanbacteria bacterium RIFCSPHIGHO2_12_FULL_44_10]|uniref:Schlafen AlbA-2 domain-containing protein n=1 Tax=Candidatus Roizmanbacteria bacterium RIFCSPHIGHO2_12_FULL_44_10 TaxID=1802054 RepID=A0A1F7I526_9BACT|nr:MAG: hypothetical protein A3F34_00180 [Candidatus Roizmanbacteria bacterium RIFCSPHIGHO2_12_FULL_44_10]
MFEITNENENIEFKNAQNGELPQNIWECITAFSNADGGFIYFGVDSKGKVIGVEEDLRDRLMTNLTSYCLSAFNHKIYVEITSEGKIIKSFIPPAPAALRPIYSKSRGFPKGGKVRIGSSNVDLDDEWLRKFSIAARGGAELVTFNGDYHKYFDDEYIKNYLGIVKEKRGNVYKGLQVEEILTKLRAIVPNGMTFFGLLAFSNTYGLQELTAPTVDIAITQYAGNSKVNPNDIEEVSVDDKEFVGNTVVQFSEAEKFILSKLPIRSRVEGGGKRARYLAIPKVAIREALANAIAHRDYSTYSGRIQIDIYSDRMEFTNPGRSIIPIDQLEKAHPEARNPLLMNYLRDLDITEHRGRGIRTIKSSLRAAGLAEPKFENRHDWFVVTIYSSAFINDDNQVWLKRFQAFALSEKQLKALVYIRSNLSGINNSEYRDINNMNDVGDDRRANIELNRLVKLNFIQKVNENKLRRYVLALKYS